MRQQGSWMQTFTGHQFWPLDPHPEDIFIEDIAHALSNICRYGGHVDRFYSVAEHSWLLSKYISKENAAWALMHDAAEAYIGDMVRPLKKSMLSFGNIETQILKAIAIRFDLPGYTYPQEVTEADNRILLTERDALMAATRHPWVQDEDGTEPLPVKVVGFHPPQMKYAFLTACEMLGIQ